MMQVQANGAAIYYELQGAGDPLILVPGYTCDHTLWNPILEMLANHFQLVLMDIRGAGRTKDNGQPLSAKLLAQDIHALVQQLKLNKPHVVGQSMGGTIAQTYAAMYPEEIGKLGLIVSTAKWRQAMLLGMRSHLTLREKEADINLILDSVLPWIYGERFLSQPRNIAMIKEILMSNPYPQSLEDQARQFKVLEQFDGRKALKNIKAPTFIMYGKEDIVALPADAVFLGQNISDAKIEGFEGGHGVIAEAPQPLADAMIRFFKSSL